MSKRNEFVTKKGTKLPILNLKGKEYLQVAHRLQWFVEDNPQYDITTQALTQTEDSVVYKTTITIFKDSEGPQPNVVKRVTATKSETKKSFPDFIEKAETGSIGRALALLGYGTQFTADELEEGQRLADAPLPSPSNEKTVEAKVSSEAPASFSSRRKAAVKKETSTDDLDI